MGNGYMKKVEDTIHKAKFHLSRLNSSVKTASHSNLFLYKKNYIAYCISFALLCVFLIFRFTAHFLYAFVVCDAPLLLRQYNPNTRCQ